MSSSGCDSVAGRLNRRIHIERVTSVPDGQGGFTQEHWVVFVSCWAEVKPRSASQVFFSESLQHRVTDIVFVRYVEGITSDMRIRDGNRILQVKAFVHLDSDEQRAGTVFTRISAEEGVAA